MSTSWVVNPRSYVFGALPVLGGNPGKQFGSCCSFFSFFATLVTTLGRAAVHVWPNPNSISFLKKGRFDASRFRSPRTDVNRGLICDNFLTGPLVQICPLTTFHYQVVATKVDQCVGHPPAVASFHPFVLCHFFFRG